MCVTALLATAPLVAFADEVSGGTDESVLPALSAVGEDNAQSAAVLEGSAQSDPEDAGQVEEASDNTKLGGADDVDDVASQGVGKEGGDPSSVEQSTEGDDALVLIQEGEALGVEVDSSEESPSSIQATSGVDLEGNAHVQNIGWTGTQTADAEGVLTLGTTGQSLHMEALQISVEGTEVPADAITYQVHVSNIGWMDWVSEGDIAGTTGKNLTIEAVRIKLSDSLAAEYDVFYKSHIQDYGWLDWASNGSVSGSTGLAKQLECVKVVLSAKGSGEYVTSDDAHKRVVVSASSHVQNIGWTKQDFVNGETITVGTTGMGLQLEAFRISFDEAQTVDGGIAYAAHVANIGWQDQVKDGAMAGTEGLSYAVEAMTASLYGDMSQQYDLYVRAHVAEVGWLDWCLSTDAAAAKVGTAGYSRQVECLQLCLVAKGGAAPSDSEVGAAFVDAAAPLVRVTGCVLVDGSETWTDIVDGQPAGTEGQGKSLTAIKLSLAGETTGTISYATHQANIGWSEVVSDGAQSGTGMSENAIEAVEITLSGLASNIYDIWYRVHEADLGWMGWTSNGSKAGTATLDLGTEAIEFKVVLKGGAAPGDTTRPYTEMLGYAQNCEYIDQNPELPWGCESVALTVVLRAMGYDISKTTVAESYLEYSDTDWVNCYSGNPFNATGMGVCMPPAIVNAANKFLSEHGSSYQAQNVTGMTFDGLMGYVNAGIPAIVWTTMYGGSPSYNGYELYGYRDYYNEHCIVVCDVDYNAGTVTVCDSLNGKVVRSLSEFSSLHEACGNMAVVIV